MILAHVKLKIAYAHSVLTRRIFPSLGLEQFEGSCLESWARTSLCVKTYVAYVELNKTNVNKFPLVADTVCPLNFGLFRLKSNRTMSVKRFKLKTTALDQNWQTHPDLMGPGINL